ncbi:MAG: hypothetical protein K2J02_01835 [Malacoplasma sp.]|nr:hypothetical protein [Malacoplasma sp.]MDE7075376.1 hypothetical protein [Malacoplasma sp.]
MNSINNRNINFMVFESLDVIENYLSSEIVKYIRSQPKLNLSIESRTDFYNLFNKLKDDFLSNRVSFRNVNFFMTDDYIFDTQSWENFAPQSSQEILKNIFFSQVDFDDSNLHPILNEIRFREFNKNIFINYDSEIDAADGLDVIVLKMQPDGSLIFNDIVDSGSLSSKGISLNTNIKANILGEFGGVQESLPVSCATLGIDQILKARKVFIVGFGANVASTLQKLFYTKDYDKTVPTCLLKSHPNVTVLVDKEASAGIFTPSKTQYISKLVETIVQPISPTENPVVAPSLEETEIYVDNVEAAQEIVEPVQEQLIEQTIVYEQEPVQEMVDQAIEIDIEDPEQQQQNTSVIKDDLESQLEDEYDFDSLNDFQDID